MKRPVHKIDPWVWEERSGHNAEGDRYHLHMMVFGNGRIMARIDCPARNEYFYQAWCHCDVPKQIKGEEDYRFVDLDSAKRFLEDMFRQFEPRPTNAPMKKQAAKKARAKRTAGGT